MTASIADSPNPIERFRHAVRSRDAEAVRRVLSESEEARAAINDPLFDFDSPALVSVAGDADVPMVETLLEFGADPNRKSSWWAGGFHPLYAASGAIADRLIEAGAIPDACAAARLNRLDLLRAMLSADPSRVHERGGDGQTPLHFAESREAIDLLLAAGADPDARDIDHRSTAAEWMIGGRTAIANRVELARYLVERGASADIFMVAALGLTDRATDMLSQDTSLLRLRTGQGEYGEKAPSSYHVYLWSLGSNLSPLQVAGKFGRDETLAAMSSFATPVERLLLACHLGRDAEAREIVRQNPRIVEGLGPVERRALTDEAWAANPPAVRLMLELGFDPAEPSISGPTGGTALHCAAWEGSGECVEAILKDPRGAALIDLREPTWNGTPLSWCSHGSRNCGREEADHPGVARLLIAAGATLDSSAANWEGSPEFMAVIRDELKRR